MDFQEDIDDFIETEYWACEECGFDCEDDQLICDDCKGIKKNQEQEENPPKSDHLRHEFILTFHCSDKSLKNGFESQFLAVVKDLRKGILEDENSRRNISFEYSIKIERSKHD